MQALAEWVTQTEAAARGECVNGANGASVGLSRMPSDTTEVMEGGTAKEERDGRREKKRANRPTG